MKKILFLGNHAFVIYNFRKELIQKLLSDGYEVSISLPYDDTKVPEMISWGCKYIETNVDRRGMNLFKDLKLILSYIKIIKSIKPDVVLSYTIKPNLYGGIACSLTKTSYINNITGLGSGFNQNIVVRKILILLYRLGLKNSEKIFFQNTFDKNTLIDKKIVRRPYEVIPGSGVNIEEYEYKPMSSDEVISFLFVGRIMKDKGILEYLEAAKRMKNKYEEKVSFKVVGFVEPTEKQLNQLIKTYNDMGIIEYLGYKNDVKPYLENCHCLIQPSHGGEGISNVLLEAGSIGRILIASDIPGCRETIDTGYNGFLFSPKNSLDLAKKIENVIGFSQEELINFGKNSHDKIVSQFNRNIVVNAYLETIKTVFRSRKG